MQVQRFSSKSKALSGAGALLNEIFSSIKKKPFLFLTSGGSAFDLLSTIDVSFFGKNSTVGVLDERFGLNPTVNNFLQLSQKEFYKKIISQGSASINSVPHIDDSLSEFAKRFNAHLRAWKNKHTDGVVVATMGMGDDGHTSGIMPYPENKDEFTKLFMGDEWIVGYDVGKKNEHPLRATSTITFLTEVVDHAVMFVSGDKKKKVMKRLLEKEGALNETPARVVHEVKDVSLFTDIMS